MGKLYFKYGVMGSSKTAQALMLKFNFTERGKNVWLLKPSIDNRDGEAFISSRIGLKEKATNITNTTSIMNLFFETFRGPKKLDVIICDEAQFLTETQINELRCLSGDYDIPVFCFGLRTDFTGHLFEGSRRLFEVADTFEEIKSVCKCGNKATINARIDHKGKIVTTGPKILIGGNDKYIGMCWSCWQERIDKEHDPGWGETF